MLPPPAFHLPRELPLCYADCRASIAIIASPNMPLVPLVAMIFSRFIGASAPLARTHFAQTLKSYFFMQSHWSELNGESAYVIFP
ncbi:hypothetical protein KCP70_11015 [Salmonella enterica subsp. enterica]|nr:hypothetical protein KCP70_11015 [Salmonella enterica subsp. enterica]